MSESKTEGEEEAKKPLKCRFKSVCVFGGSSIGKSGEFLRAATDLGNVLADRRIHIVYGGGVQGLDGAAAISASVKGSDILSICVKVLEDRKYTLGKEIKVSSLPERIGFMLYNAEAYIALPGGLETLDAISTMSYWASLNFHQKPIGLLNVNGFYDGLLSFLDHAVEQGFIPQASRCAIISAPTAGQLIKEMHDYVPKPNSWVKPMNQQTADSIMEHEPDTTLRL